MSPLYRFDNKLLIHDNKLATKNACCCFRCLTAYCGCNNYTISFSELWRKIKPYTQALYTCTRGDEIIQVRCGDWKPVGQRECCTGPCYDIWNYILGYLGYNSYVENNLSPDRLDQLCPGGMTFPHWILPSGFDASTNNLNRFILPKLDRNHAVNILPEGIPNQPWIGFVPDNFPFVHPIADTTFVTLYGEPNNNDESPVNRLLRAGSFPPYTAKTYYSNPEDCRKCFGALFKLGTPDAFGRQSTVDINSSLTNAVSGEIKTSTKYLFSTSDKLSAIDCIASKFGNGEIYPYGILTNQLSSSPFIINASPGESDNYFEFDLRYKYEITWDNPPSPTSVWHPFTNKWRIKYGPYGDSIFSFSGYPNNYYDNNAPIPLSASINNLDFTPNASGVGTYININWNNNGIKIGNTDCSFKDAVVDTNLSRSQPTITISSTGAGVGATFTPSLQSFTESGGQKYWVISNVTIGGSGTGYTNNEILQVNIAQGDIEEIPAILRLTTSQPEQIIQPNIDAVIDTISTSLAILSVSTEQYQSDPNRWRISNVSINNKGEGYNDGVYPVNFIPYNGSIEEIAATALAITERKEPTFSYSIVSDTGQGASIDSISLNIVTNSNGQKAWNFDYFICVEGGFSIVSGGSGYLSTDYLELNIESEAIIDNNYSPNEFYIPQFSSKIWRVPLDIDENGTIIGINGGNIFNTEAFYIPTGKIEEVIISNVLNGEMCGHSYPIDNPELYGGSYYKTTSGGEPLQVLIDNNGKYYHPNIGTIRPVSGPCITGIKMDIWHPGPCGLTFNNCNFQEILEKTSGDTPWEGYYYGNLVQDEYVKYWVYYTPTPGATLPGHPYLNKPTDTPTFGVPQQSGTCPCCIVTNFGLIVVKYEGCESFRADKNYEITLQQYEMDFEHCNLGVEAAFFYNGNVYTRPCNILNERRNCGSSSNVISDDPEIVDYKNDSGGCSNQDINGYIPRQFLTNIPTTYTYRDGNIQCVTLDAWLFDQNNPNRIPGFENCASGIINPVFASGNIICPSL